MGDWAPGGSALSPEGEVQCPQGLARDAARRTVGLASKRLSRPWTPLVLHPGQCQVGKFLPRHKGEKGKAGLPSERVLPACVRRRPGASPPPRRGRRGLLRGLACCLHLCLLVHSSRVCFFLKQVQCRPGGGAPEEGAGIWGSSGLSQGPWGRRSVFPLCHRGTGMGREMGVCKLSVPCFQSLPLWGSQRCL